MATRDAVSDLIRGNIDAIILCSLSEGDNYGYEILKGIAQASRGEYEMKELALYKSQAIGIAGICRELLG